jgi:hypothetical protein
VPDNVERLLERVVRLLQRACHALELVHSEVSNLATVVRWLETPERRAQREAAHVDYVRVTEDKPAAVVRGTGRQTGMDEFTKKGGRAK